MSTGEKQSYKKQTMPFELYKKIIDDLSKFPERLKMIRLVAHGEPLLNPHFTDMVRYTKKAGVCNWIETITNGSRLTPELNDEFAASGLDRIRISVEAPTEEGYKETAGVDIDMEKFTENIRDLYKKCQGRCEIYIKTVDIALPDEKSKQDFFNRFDNICDKIFIEKLIPIWSDFDELNDRYDIDDHGGLYGQEVRNIQICPFPFYSAVINPDGIVTVCCADWKRRLVIGDLNYESMKEIWNGQKLHHLWMEFAAGRKNDCEACRKCLSPNYNSHDYLDDHSELILNNLKKRFD